MKVNDKLVNKLTENDANWSNAENEVVEEYWADDGAVAFRDECGNLWIDHAQMDEPYASNDDEHPSEDGKIVLFNEATQTWISLRDDRGEWYRLTNERDEEAFVLVSLSEQQTPYERELTVIGKIPEGEWTVAAPTPYEPRAILRAGTDK